MSAIQIAELIRSLDVVIAAAAKEENLGMSHRVGAMLAYTIDSTEALHLVAVRVDSLKPDEIIAFGRARDRLLLYLVYISKLDKYFNSDRSYPLNLYSLFPTADFFDWKQAETEALKLYRQFQETDGEIPLPEPLT